MSNNRKNIVDAIIHMVHNEASVSTAIWTLQKHCLCNGISMQFQNGQAASPAFQAYVERHYTKFCKNAIETCMAVGFIPFRLRRGEQGLDVFPEVLSLGTFSWTVQPSRDKKPGQPLLLYDVKCQYCTEPIHVVAYAEPSIYFTCNSPLVSLLGPYTDLLLLRAQTQAAETWNSRPNFVIQELDATKINDAMQLGVCINKSTASVSAQDTAHQQHLRSMYTLVNSVRKDINLPDESTVLVVPKNNTVQPMAQAHAPAHMLEREHSFFKMVCLVFGIPPSMLTYSDKASAPDNSSNSQELHFMKTCNWLNKTLCEALEIVYRLSFETMKVPKFEIPLVPVNMTMDDAVGLLSADLLSTKDASRIARNTLGVDVQQVKKQKLETSDGIKAKAQSSSSRHVAP